MAEVRLRQTVSAEIDRPEFWTAYDALPRDQQREKMTVMLSVVLPGKGIAALLDKVAATETTSEIDLGVPKLPGSS